MGCSGRKCAHILLEECTVSGAMPLGGNSSCRRRLFQQEGVLWLGSILVRTGALIRNGYSGWEGVSGQRLCPSGKRCPDGGGSPHAEMLPGGAPGRICALQVHAKYSLRPFLWTRQPSGQSA
jgi:hypothetical protein